MLPEIINSLQGFKPVRALNYRNHHFLTLPKFNFLIGLILSCFLISCAANAQNNIAPLATVSVSPNPNYSYTSGKNNPSYLTNGIYASGATMWVDPQTLGWSHISKIVINFSFEKPYALSGLSVHTAARMAAGVYWPLNILVFTSLDGKSFQQVGDIMQNADESGTNYAVRTFTLSNLKNIAAKYVRLVAVPSGDFFFTDEIQIFGTPANAAQIKTSGANDRLNISSLSTLISNSGITARNRKFLMMISNNVGENVNSKGRELLNKINQDIQQSGQLDSAQYIDFKNRIDASRIRNNLPGRILLSGYSSPWSQDLNSYDFATEPSLTLNTSLDGTTSGEVWYSLNLFNNSNTNQQLTYQIENRSQIQFKIFYLKDVQTRDSKLIPDAMIPVLENQKIPLAPGQSRIILISARSGKTGDFSPSITFNGDRTSATVNFSYSIKNIKPELINFHPLNVDVWAYYNDPFYNGLVSQVHEDLLNHGVNVMVIPPYVNNRAIFDGDYSLLDNFLGESSGFDHVFLFLDFRTLLGKNSGFLTNDWKAKFLKGLNQEVKEIENSGFKQDQIYLYPFDEVKPWEVSGYLDFVKWFQSVYPKMKLFTTIYDKGIYNQIKGYPTICQILVNNPDLDQIAQDHTESQFWIYDIMDNEKSTDPYFRYRLLPWKAFVLGATGVGFWNYANMSGSSVWDDFDGNNADYNAVYNWNGIIIPSRRWAAFQRGMDDYKILSAYAERYGIKEARSLAMDVIGTPANPDYASEIVSKMLQKL